MSGGQSEAFWQSGMKTHLWDMQSWPPSQSRTLPHLTRLHVPVQDRLQCYSYKVQISNCNSANSDLYGEKVSTYVVIIMAAMFSVASDAGVGVINGVLALLGIPAVAVVVLCRETVSDLQGERECRQPEHVALLLCFESQLILVRPQSAFAATSHKHRGQFVSDRDLFLSELRYSAIQR